MYERDKRIGLLKVQMLKFTSWLMLLIALSPPSEASTCETGRLQSPINIISATTTKILATLKFDYIKSPLIIANDGHTLRIRIRSSSQLHIEDQIFTLSQFHFHTPGGDQIDGEEFPMAAHLLHKNAAGQLLAVVVLFRLGNESPILSTLLGLIPDRVNVNQSYPNLLIDPKALLPTLKGYYRYKGSLTAPPCTEGLDWIVLKVPLELSSDQLASYRKHFADNGRKPQASHRRAVFESQ